MKKTITALLALFFILTNIQFAYGQIYEEETNNIIKADFNISEGIKSGKKTIFDASNSYTENQENLSYKWDFGDGNKEEGIETLHTFSEPGIYKVTLEISDGETTDFTEKEILVYRKQILLITDLSEEAEKIYSLKDFAEKEAVYLNIIESFGSSTEFISEEILSKKLQERKNEILDTNHILIWTNGNAGINALSRLSSNNPEILKQLNITIINNAFTKQISRIQNQFNAVNPKSIILVKESSIYPLIESSTDEKYLKTLKEGGYDYKIIESNEFQIRPWNFMSYFVNILINQGIPDNTIALLLLLPVIATIIVILKQIVGITAYGIYTPSIITLSFLIIGFEAGMITLLTAVSVGVLIRILLEKTRMLFIPKVAVVISSVSFSLLGLLILNSHLQVFNSQYLSLSIFPMLILSTLVERLIKVKNDKRLIATFIITFQTIFISLIAFLIAGGEINLHYFTIKFEYIKQLVLTIPELTLLLPIINIFIGKWSGLRLIERYKFREVFNHVEE